VRAVLGIPDDAPEDMTPNELIHWALQAPVDLLWNGGIGTYVKATKETDTEVGDRTNDLVRINGDEVHARVVGEGGNLGFTQRGRIEYALTSGRINTDFIDNSAGVDTSDHEVNLKILLGLAIARGELTVDDRNTLVQGCAHDVVEHVLYDNYLQAQILSQSEAAADQRWDAYEDLMRELEGEGLLNRSIEFLPTQDVLAERRRSGRPLTRPELAVLLAYAKRSLRDKIFDSTLPDDPWLDRELRRYFPAKLLEATGDLYREHRLRREIIATVVTNDVLNSLGVTWVTRLVTETGAEHADVVRAFWIARDVSHAVERWDEVEALFDDPRIDSALQMLLMEGVDWLVEVLARWYLQHSIGEDLSEVVKRDEPDFSELARSLRRLGSSEWRAERALRREAMVAQGVPSAVAEAAAWHPELSYAPDIIVASRSTGRPLTEAADAFFLLGEQLGIDWLEGQVESLQADTKWQRWALGAITDDLRRVRREIAERVLALDHGDVRAAIDAFLESRADAIGRLSRTLAGLRTEGVPDVAAATVAVRQLRAALG
jgi:glutamate dehydrogenase